MFSSRKEAGSPHPEIKRLTAELVESEAHKRLLKERIYDLEVQINSNQNDFHDLHQYISHLKEKSVTLDIT